MKTTKILKLRDKAIKEAQKEIDKIFEKYSKLIVENIQTQLPKNHSLISGNGCCFVEDENANKVIYGSAWSRIAGNKQMEKLAELQYGTERDELQGCFSIPNIIENKSK